MKVVRPSGSPTEPLDPANFTGAGTLMRVPGLCGSPEVNAYVVTFEAGARTAWHSHSGPQILVVTAGRCRVRSEEGPARDVEAGGIVSIEPGEVHWHGAAPNAPATHVALNVEAGTTWLGAVSDEDYAST